MSISHFEAHGLGPHTLIHEPSVLHVRVQPVAELACIPHIQPQSRAPLTSARRFHQHDFNAATNIVRLKRRPVFQRKIQVRLTQTDIHELSPPELREYRSRLLAWLTTFGMPRASVLYASAPCDAQSCSGRFLNVMSLSSYSV